MRIFLSHSSEDKARYCNALANKLIERLGKDSIVYDAITFEAGEKSVDEINRTLGYSDLYVILLSQSSVERPWVKYELASAKEKLTEHTLNRIYPLIIDENLKYSDPRIPEWLREYNLKYIARPNKAAKLIVERAQNVRWTRHPDFWDKSQIFVGRNNLIDEFEARIDDFSKPPLNTIIVRGLPNIGRRSLAKHCLVKGTITPQYYEFLQVSLTYQESIEDFIYKISDLGFSDKEVNIKEVALKTMEEKEQLAVEISEELSKIAEIVLIKDDGCIVDYRGRVAKWYKEIVNARELSEKIVFVVVTKYKLQYESVRNIPSIFVLNVPELSLSERKGLLRRLSEANGLSLNREMLEFIGQYLTGYPAQVHYAIDIVKNEGYPYLKANSKLLLDFNEQEVSSLLEKYKEDSKVLEILALVSKYDAVGIDMLHEILSVTPEYEAVYENLFNESFFELEGVNGEYVRLNEVIKNYIARAGVKTLTAHEKKAQEIFERIFSDDASPWYNATDKLLAIRETIKEGKQVEFDYVIPSVYLKSMSDLYADMKYEDVVRLGQRVLMNTENIDGGIIYETRYLMCSALAKLKKASFLDEIQKLEYYDKLFLTAFYYRQVGKADRALEKLNELLKYRPEMSKAKREKILVLKNLQQYEEATILAKENYYQYSDNPYHIQAYFDCLINVYNKNPDDDLLSELLSRLGKIQSEKARSMYGRCQALYLAYVEGELDAAISKIQETIRDYPRDKKYALVVKFDIAQRFNDIRVMEETIKELEIENSAPNTVVICKSKLLASTGKVDEAVVFFNRSITFFPEESKKAFAESLKSYHLKGV